MSRRVGEITRPWLPQPLEGVVAPLVYRSGELSETAPWGTPSPPRCGGPEGIGAGPVYGFQHFGAGVVPPVFLRPLPCLTLPVCPESCRLSPHLVGVVGCLNYVEVVGATPPIGPCCGNFLQGAGKLRGCARFGWSRLRRASRPDWVRLFRVELLCSIPLPRPISPCLWLAGRSPCTAQRTRRFSPKLA